MLVVLQTSDKIAFVALVVALMSLVTGLVAIFIGKRLEIVYEKFDRLCLQNIISIIKPLDDFFDSIQNQAIGQVNRVATDTMLDLQILLIQLKNIYPKIDVKIIEQKIEGFTDEIYSHAGVHPNSYFKAKYIALKLDILNYMYEFTITEKLRIREVLMFWNWFRF